MTTQHFLALELDTDTQHFGTIGIFATPDEALAFVRARPNYDGCDYGKFVVEMWEGGTRTLTVVVTIDMTAARFNSRPRFVLVTTAYDQHGDESVTGAFHGLDEALAFTHPDTAPVEEPYPGEEPRVRKHPTVDLWAGDMSYGGMEVTQVTTLGDLNRALNYDLLTKGH